MRWVQEIDSEYNHIPYTMGGRPGVWMTTVLQRFFHRNESSEPCVMAPLLGIQHWEEAASEHLSLKA